MTSTATDRASTTSWGRNAWLLLFAVLSVACSLDLSGRTTCDTQSDCVTGFQCVAHTCARPASPGVGPQGKVDPDPTPEAGDGGELSDGSGGSAPLAGSGGSAPTAGSGGSVEPANPCATNNGDCDPHQSCASTPLGEVQCGQCPQSYVVDEAGRCVPKLLGLVPSEGTLSPAFDPLHTEYTVSVPLLVASLTLAVEIPPKASVHSGGADLDASGYLPATALKPGDTRIELVVDEPGQPSRTYSVTVTRAFGGTQQAAYVKPSQNLANRYLGFEVALDGDTVAFGSNSANFVDIYVRSSGTWSFQKRLAPALVDESDGFGASIALHGDTLVVGAPFEDSADGTQQDNSALNTGAVYVFTRSGSDWTERAYLKASNRDNMDEFGSELALTPDPEHSGAYILAVSAPFESSVGRGIDQKPADNSAFYAGAVYVFGGSGANWTQRAYVKASNTMVQPDHYVGAEFGTSISLSGTRLAVGAPNETSAATGVNSPGEDRNALCSGAAYVFDRTGGVWTQTAYVKASNTHAIDNFGVSVAIDGPRLAVGAYYEHSVTRGVNAQQLLAPGDHPSGAVYVFEFNGAKWGQTTFIKSSNSDDGDWFGQAVALRGDLLAVTASREASGSNDPNDNSAPGAGAAYLFSYGTDGWVERRYLKAAHPGGSQSSPNGVGDGFGQSLALGANVLAVGAPYESGGTVGVGGSETDDTSPSSGAVYLFD